VQIAPGVDVDDAALAALCDRSAIVRLALFGSALHGPMTDDSDVDLLVTFRPDRTPGLLRVAALELELEALIGRPVDLRTAADLSPYFRDEVVAEATPLYDVA